MPPPRPQLNVDTVRRFREEFLDQYTDDGHNEAYDPRDVRKLRNDDKYVHKFLMIAKMDFKLTGEKVNSAFKWRKQFGLNDLSFDSFDEEALSLGGFYSHNVCKIGRRLVWFKICKHRKDASRTHIIKQFMAFWLNKLESERMGEDVVVIMDMTNAGLNNMDMDVIKFMITCFELYFPALVGIMLVYDMHWVLNAIWKVIEKLLSPESREHIKFLKGKAIEDLIAPDQLPLYMGGTDMWEWTWPPTRDEELDVNEEEEEEEEVTLDLQEDSMLSLPNGDLSHVQAEDRAPSSSPQSSPAAKPKRVHFAPESPPKRSQEDGGHTRTNNKRTVKRTTKTQKQHAHKGPLLTIRPGDQLVFEEPTEGLATEASQVMSLTNTTEHKVAYKIKTTTPDRYKVRPSAGPINPGASINVTITLLQPSREAVARDKFLVIATELREVLRTPVELTEFWKRVDREEITEHRVRCMYVSSKKSEMDICELKKDVVTLNRKVDTLTRQVSSLTESTSKLLRMVMLQLLLLVCCLLHYLFFSGGSAQPLPPSHPGDFVGYPEMVRDPDTCPA